MPAVLTKKRPAAVKPTVDYPQRSETIVSEGYSIRLTVPDGALGVEVSIDEGLWQSCRPAAGHWWYDWADYPEGSHRIVARHALPDGRRVSSEPRKTVVRRGSPQSE